MENESELHISGVVVFSHSSHCADVAAQIKTLPAATVFASTADGRIIVTLETESTERTLGYLDAIRALPGVIDVALVYEHAESRAALEEEIK